MSQWQEWPAVWPATDLPRTMGDWNDCLNLNSIHSQLYIKAIKTMLSVRKTLDISLCREKFCIAWQ